jgi:hypothetical protein
MDGVTNGGAGGMSQSGSSEFRCEVKATCDREVV